jgi:hypothetical protein
MNTKKIVLTEEEFSNVKSKLEDLKLQLYKTDFNLEKYLDESFTQQEKDFASQGLNSKASPTETEKSIETALKNLSNIETVSIKLAIEPTVAFINWIKEFLQDKTSKSESNILLKINTDKSLVAGAEIEFNGKIKSQNIKNEILNICSVNN